jgi:hypothetical protein
MILIQNFIWNQVVMRWEFICRVYVRLPISVLIFKSYWI